MTFKYVFSAVAALGCSFAAFAADILVPQDAPTIQAAIKIAQDGDRVLLAAGTYQEQINTLGKSVTIEGPAGATSTIIDGGGTTGYVITVSGGAPTFRGVTITGGFGPSSVGQGGGMLIQNNASVIVEDSTIADNTGLLGGGAVVLSASATFRNTSVTNNQALQGGGVYIEFGNLTIENSAFEDNRANGFGGAIAIFWLTNATITDTAFRKNIAVNAGLGGAVYANAATLNFARLDFIENGKAEPGHDGVSWIISTGGGGAIYTTSTNGRIEATRILRNVAAFGSGVYVAGQGTLELVNSLIAENGAVCQCGTGAVYANSASPVITNCTIAGNGGFSSIYTTYNSFPTVTNTIIAGQQNNLGSQNPTAGNGVTSLNYCLLQGDPFAVNLGIGNIVVTAWPELDAEADYALPAGSPAIDAGNNSAVPAGIVTDLLGNPRFVDALGEGAIVDIGAVEFQTDDENNVKLIAGDMNHDNTVDVVDLLMLLGAWGPCPAKGECPADLNGSGNVDVTDLLILLGNWG